MSQSEYSRFYKTLSQTGPDWSATKSSRQNIQIVPRTPEVSYNVLSHDLPATESGYFPIHDAYNEVFSERQCGYNFVNRGCDGSFVNNSAEYSDHLPTIALNKLQIEVDKIIKSLGCNIPSLVNKVRDRLNELHKVIFSPTASLQDVENFARDKYYVGPLDKNRFDRVEKVLTSENGPCAFVALFNVYEKSRSFKDAPPIALQKLARLRQLAKETLVHIESWRSQKNHMNQYLAYDRTM